MTKRCKTNNCMKVNGSDGMSSRRGHKESPSRPPPPILPKPKFILPPTSTTNLVLQRNLKSKSELNIATQSNFSSSSAACSSSSSSSSSTSSSHRAPNDIEPEAKLVMAKSNTFQQQKPRNKILENNSLISTSQGYQSDTWESHSSRQSFDMDNQYNSKFSHNLIKSIQEIKKIKNASTSSDDTENENGHFKKKSILVQKADSASTSSSSSTVSSGSNSSSSAAGLTSSATISDGSMKKLASYESFQLPVTYQTNCPSNEINSSNSFFYSRSNQQFSDLYA